MPRILHVLEGLLDALFEMVEKRMRASVMRHVEPNLKVVTVAQVESRHGPLLVCTVTWSPTFRGGNTLQIRIEDPVVLGPDQTVASTGDEAFDGVAHLPRLLREAVWIDVEDEDLLGLDDPVIQDGIQGGQAEFLLYFLLAFLLLPHACDQTAP